MRVLLLFPIADGQTGPAIKYAFEQLGHEVMAVDAKLEAGNSYITACHFRPNLVFCSRTKELTEHVQKIKQRFDKVVVCMWNVDTRNTIQEWKHLFPLIKLSDYHFVVACNLISDWQRLNPNTFWLPQGLQNEIYDKPTGLSGLDVENYQCDVSFAGSITGFHAWRRSYLEAIAKMGLNFKRWGHAGKPQVYNEEHNKMVVCSKINLGMSGWHKNGKYTSVRDYKVLGAGGFLLEYAQDGIFEVIPRNTFSDYKDIEQLKRHIDWWLSHEEYRKEIAQNGYSWVHSHATYTRRIQQALEIMKL